ncbi:unnamed protein product [Cuscuta europaea]|uniref:non-specific serine/threonine protein kinase n=1 Tax=Cuscuta europaea TaxID=41803 RepID=A0A9P0ZQZ4_CUSEU|nr:unnamed protein product [Cuscuta europaea]
MYRLNHKNLLRLIGYSCYENDERMLILEVMENGTLHHHLHSNDTNNATASGLMSWNARIRVALDVARGIKYLHEYAILQVIHRDIKSSNILLDANWNAKVANFGLSVVGPKSCGDDDVSHVSLLAAGTTGYMDLENYRLQVVTTKNDVYNFGVVLLELLSGRRAVEKNEKRVPINVVDCVVAYILRADIGRVLDVRVPCPTPFEMDQVACVGYLAADCVTLWGRDRPSMTEIVKTLERALAACLAPPMFSPSNTDDSECFAFYSVPFI